MRSKESLFLSKVNFFLPQIAQFDKSNLLNIFYNWCNKSPLFFSNIFHRSFRIFYFFFYLIISLNTLLNETNFSLLIYESIKVVGFRSSIVFKVSFPKNTILSCFFFFFFFIIDWYFLIFAVTAKLTAKPNTN